MKFPQIPSNVEFLPSTDSPHAPRIAPPQEVPGRDRGQDALDRQGREIVRLELDVNTGEILAVDGTASAIRRACEHLLDDIELEETDGHVEYTAATRCIPPLRISEDDWPEAESDRMAFSRAQDQDMRRQANPMAILSRLMSRPEKDAPPSPSPQGAPMRELHAMPREGGA